MVECIASLVDVCAGYGAREVLHTLTWSIKAGEFWGLIGPNGSGKSTLLGLFNAMTPASSGHVFFQGEEVTRTNLHRVRTKIAHVFQMVEVDRKIPVTVYEAVLAGTFSKLGLFHRPGAREKALALKAGCQRSTLRGRLGRAKATRGYRTGSGARARTYAS